MATGLHSTEATCVHSSDIFSTKIFWDKLIENFDIFLAKIGCALVHRVWSVMRWRIFD